ncbi:hypothetical protein [Schaalia sp. Marseille-Q2122]|uniref:hypothetical protein n=1 Tax=Schaalia sp. Marseille-Q2122 TaxID=2736604 RepID=UPI00158E014E|nr:hypothetical protein [Schaalia sp. Marseille-Q2122]
MSGGDKLRVMEKHSFIPPAPPHHVAARFATIAVVSLVVRSPASPSVLSVAALLAIVAILRAITPGRPWFSSRNRIADTALLLAIAAAIVYFSPYVNVAAP